MSSDMPWLAVGFLGQAAFSARFLVQWLVSEARRQSVIPYVFWWFSLLGGSLLLAYALWRGDPVFIIGQAFGLLVYLRNLMLIRRAGAAGRRAAGQDHNAERQDAAGRAQ